MDRKNLWQVGGRGGRGAVLTGTLANRPAAGLAGRIYIVNNLIATVTAVGGGGTAYGVPTVDIGSDWARMESAVWISRPTITVTGVAQTNIARFSVAPSVLVPDHRMTIRVISKVAQSSATSVTYTLRVRWGTASIAISGLAQTISATGVPDTTVFSLVGVSGTLIRPGESSRSIGLVGSALGHIWSNASGVLSNSASQILNVSIQLNKNTVSTYRPLYVEARWA